MTQTAIFAHRGVSSLYPENTMAAFQAAADLGVEGIELDVQLSKERVPVVIHDPRLQRTTNGEGSVKDFSVKELKELTAGVNFEQTTTNEKIPTLEEVLQFAKTNNLIFNIELKGYIWEREEMLDSVIQMITDHRLEKRVVISSFDHKELRMWHERNQDIELAALVTGALNEPETYLKSVGASVGYHYKTPLLLEDEVKHLIELGIQLRPYTVNDPDWLKRYMEWGCSGVITDYPQIALDIRRQLEE